MKLYAPLIGSEPLDVLVQCFAADSEREKLSAYNRQAYESLTLSPRFRNIEISHHYAHAMLALASGFNDAAILVIDHHGSPGRLVTDHAVPENLLDHVEANSIYHLKGDKIEPVEKHYWAMASRGVNSLGGFYSLGAEFVLGRAFREGVLTGLAAYGNPNAFKFPEIDVDGSRVSVPEEWLNFLLNTKLRDLYALKSSNFQKAADISAAIQHHFEIALAKLGARAQDLTGSKNLVYVGGCALNCTANSRLIDAKIFEKVFIPPACDDGGTSLGCAIYGAKFVGEGFEAPVWGSDYWGPTESRDVDIPRIAKEYGLKASRPSNLPVQVAELLSQGFVIGLYQGRSEVGARALGNRSIIADSRYDVMRHYINTNVKGREWFRPLAPATPSDCIQTYFHGSEWSPYMLQRSYVVDTYKEKLGAVTHVDGSARVQTVAEENNKFFYDTLKQFGEITDLPVLLNTSFNGRDEPIVETISDAVKSYLELPLHFLVVPPFLIEKPMMPPSVYSM